MHVSSRNDLCKPSLSSGHTDIICIVLNSTDDHRWGQIYYRGAYMQEPKTATRGTPFRSSDACRKHYLTNYRKNLRGSLIPGGGGFPETTNSPWVLSFRCGSLPPRPTDPDPCTQGPDGGRSRHDGRSPDEGTRDPPISVLRAPPPGNRRPTSEHPPTGGISQGYSSPLGY